MTFYTNIFWPAISHTAQTMKFSTKDFSSKCDQIRNFLWIRSHLLKKSLMWNFIFCAVSCTLMIWLFKNHLLSASSWKSTYHTKDTLSEPIPRKVSASLFFTKAADYQPKVSPKKVPSRIYVAPWYSSYSCNQNLIKYLR